MRTDVIGIKIGDNPLFGISYSMKDGGLKTQYRLSNRMDRFTKDNKLISILFSFV